MTNQSQLFEGDGASGTLRREPWDCVQLGLESAKVEHLTWTDAARGSVLLQRIIESARSQGFRHLAVRTATTDRAAIEALQFCSFRLVDTVVTLTLTRSDDRPPPSNDRELRWATAHDAPQIGELAAQAFSDPTATFNRYVNDPRLTREQVERVYRTWGATSVGGPAADATLTAWSEDRLVGFLTVKGPKEGVASVPLNAVAPSERGKGVYKTLVLAAAHHVFDLGAERFNVTTQLQQVAVQRVWARLGARLVASHHSFHLWLD